MLFHNVTSSLEMCSQFVIFNDLLPQNTTFLLKTRQLIAEFIFFYCRTSLFIITSLVYAIILVVVCIAYVLSDVTTHRIPVLYYEGFFTYL